MTKSCLEYKEIAQGCGIQNTVSDVEAMVLSCCFEQLIECRIDQRAEMIYVTSISDTRDVPEPKVQQLIESLKNWQSSSLSKSLQFFEAKSEEMDMQVVNDYQNSINVAQTLDENMK